MSGQEINEPPVPVRFGSPNDSRTEKIRNAPLIRPAVYLLPEIQMEIHACWVDGRQGSEEDLRCRIYTLVRPFKMLRNTREDNGTQREVTVLQSCLTFLTTLDS